GCEAFRLSANEMRPLRIGSRGHVGDVSLVVLVLLFLLRLARIVFRCTARRTIGAPVQRGSVRIGPSSGIGIRPRIRCVAIARTATRSVASLVQRGTIRIGGLTRAG